MAGSLVIEIANPKCIGKQWVWKGGFPHLVAKDKIKDGGW